MVSAFTSEPKGPRFESWLDQGPSFHVLPLYVLVFSVYLHPQAKNKHVSGQVESLNGLDHIYHYSLVIDFTYYFA